MSRFTTRGVAAVSLFFTAACSQMPAQVDYKGHENFGRHNNTMLASYTPSGTVTSSYVSSSYTAAAPVVTVSTAAEPAAVSAIDIGELKPLPQQQADAGDIQKVNPWTGKPRTEFIQQQQPKAEEPKAAQLDNIFDDNGVKAGRAQPVRLSVDSNSFIWPVTGNKVISNFGPKGSGKVNDGINIAAGTGEPVWAADNGEVIYSGNDLAGYGNMIIIKHPNNKTTTYAHLSNATVDKYDRVKQGDIIGYVGSTGNVSSPQLHFAVREGKQAVDPMKYLSRSVAGL